MAGSTFQIKSEDVQKVQDAIKTFGDGAEQILNEYLITQANEIFTESIINLIPVSDRDKRHARQNAPFTGEQKANLELYIHTKKPYHYLYFPDEGEGTSLGQQAHDFMGEGVEAKYDEVINGMLDALMNNFNL